MILQAKLNGDGKVLRLSTEDNVDYTKCVVHTPEYEYDGGRTTIYLDKNVLDKNVEAVALTILLEGYNLKLFRFSLSDYNKHLEFISKLSVQLRSIVAQVWGEEIDYEFLPSLNLGSILKGWNFISRYFKFEWKKGDIKIFLKLPKELKGALASNRRVGSTNTLALFTKAMGRALVAQAHLSFISFFEEKDTEVQVVEE